MGFVFLGCRGKHQGLAGQRTVGPYGRDERGEERGHGAVRVQGRGWFGCEPNRRCCLEGTHVFLARCFLNGLVCVIILSFLSLSPSPSPFKKVVFGKRI